VDRAVCDPALLDELGAGAAGEHPDAVTHAATAGRWDLVIALARHGFPLGRSNERTALHLAAGAGALHAVRVLVEHGADTTAADPIFGETALGWARYFGSTAVAAYLANGG
jgi:ankyrin repeat protein